MSVGQKSVSQKKRGSKLLRCGAKRQVAAFAGTRVYLLSLIFFDEGRNEASAPHSGELGFHVSLVWQPYRVSTVGDLSSHKQKSRPAIDGRHSLSILSMTACRFAEDCAASL